MIIWLRLYLGQFELYKCCKFKSIWRLLDFIRELCSFLLYMHTLNCSLITYTTKQEKQGSWNITALYSRLIQFVLCTTTMPHRMTFQHGQFEQLQLYVIIGNTEQHILCNNLQWNRQFHGSTKCSATKAAIAFMRKLMFTMGWFYEIKGRPIITHSRAALQWLWRPSHNQCWETRYQSPHLLWYWR